MHQTPQNPHVDPQLMSSTASNGQNSQSQLQPKLELQSQSQQLVATVVDQSRRFHYNGQQIVRFSDIHREEYKNGNTEVKLPVSCSVSSTATRVSSSVTSQFQQRRPWRRRVQTWLQQICNRLLTDENATDGELRSKSTLELERKEADTFALQLKDLQLPPVLERGVMVIMKGAGQLNGVKDSPLPSAISRTVTVTRNLMNEISRVSVTLGGYCEISALQLGECIDQVESVVGDLFGVSSTIDRLQETVQISIDKKV